jgi:Tfp pilus assembly protein FimT
MLTLAVIVIVTALTWPTLMSMYGQARVTAGADAFRAGLAYARGQAIEDGQAYRIGVVPGSGNFRVAPDTPSYWGNGGGTQDNGDTPVFIYEEHLPDGVVFSEDGTPVEVERDASTHKDPSTVAPGDYHSVAVFLPDGTARDDSQVLVCARGGSPLLVNLRSLTGEVSVTRYQTQGGK